MARTEAPEGEKKIGIAALCCCDSIYGFGDGGCRPQEQDEAPRGSAAATGRVVAGSQLSSVTMSRFEERRE